MKKTLFLALSATIICNCAYSAPCSINVPINKCDNGCKQYNIEQQCKKDVVEPCKEREFKDQNKCFFDKKFKEMKKILCLNPQQETNIDCIYDRYKNQMEILHNKMKHERECLCKMINTCADNATIRAHKRELKDIERDVKAQYKSFCKEIKEQLCKDQVKTLNRYHRQEKSKMRKLGKYCLVPKFPCDCGCNIPKCNCR